MEKLVSIITPCFNGEQFVHRFLDSVLNQTYTNIELIFVNDGSTDKTEEIVKSYIKKLEERGMKLIYIYQENKGLAGAINVGLQIFTGDYLAWPDSDDFLSRDSIEKRVAFLELHEEYGIVSSDAYLFKENNLKSPIGFVSNKNPNRFEEKKFYDLLTENSIFCPGCHLVRTSAFLEVNLERHIYEARRGQNWQLLLPIYYKYKAGFIDEPLYNYVIYKNSMSRGDDTLNKCIYRCEEHEKILNNTISKINMSEIEKKNCFDLIRKRYLRKKLNIARLYKDEKLLNEQYELLKSLNDVNFKDKIIYYSGKYQVINILINILNKIRRVIKVFTKTSESTK